MIIELELPPFHRVQQEIADDKTRFRVLACGRRFGKTLMCTEIGFSEAFTGHLVWWVAPTYSQAGIAWRLAIKLVNQIPAEYGIVINIATRTITFPSGGQFVFKSSDRPDSLRGEGLDLLIMDEADFQKKNVWTEILRATLADKKGRAIFISTPKVENGWFHQLFKDGMNPKIKNVKSWQLSSYTNPYLDPAEIDEIRESTPSLIFRREFLAEFVSAAGARINKNSIQYISIDELQNNKNLVIGIGVDLAIGEKEINDYTAVCALAYDTLTKFYYVLDIKRDRCSFAKQKAMIKDMCNKWNRPDLKWPEPIIGIEDVAYQRAMVQEFQKEVPFAVYGVNPKGKNKVANFASMESRYELNQVFHVENLPLSFENELLSFPEGEHDDYEDALVNAKKAIDLGNGFISSSESFLTLGGEEGFEF